ncbi:MAG: 2-C-methyl-D-erythritol 4-phosphate cytidylyltransferase [Actinomycetales bacterium]|nr:2-C-methyl-D-erythritol 4-phosphate cytidylyltransferase [Actinomycetales bacterium]
MSVGVVIVAAGSGTRLGAAQPKAFVPVAGAPLLTHAVRAATAAAGVSAVVVVAPTTHLDDAAALVEPVSRSSGIPVQVVPGGAERGDSVLAGLRWLPQECDIVLVHDAARAFAPPELFERVAAAVTEQTPAIVPGLPVVDTIKVVDDDGFVRDTPDRASLRAVQTPQGFRRDVLLAAHATHGSSATDDATLVERLGLRVLVVDGHPAADKITTPADVVRLERLVLSEP